MIKIRCNICGSSSYQFLFHGQDRLLKADGRLFNVVKCNLCGLAYLNPQPSQEELKEYYPENYDQYHDGAAVFKYGFFSRFIKFFLDSYKKDGSAPNCGQPNSAEPAINYLDFGCGGGAHLKKLKKEHPAWHFYGLDNNDFACEQTKQKGFEVFCGDIAEIELPENFFDVVNMSHALEHLNDPKRALLKVNGILKKGGKVIIALPNFDSLAAKLFKKYWQALEAPRHLFFFTPRTAALLLKQAGLAVNGISFTKGARVEILSLYYWLRKKDMRINPIVWRIFKPIAFVLYKLKKTSVMTISAEK